MMGVGVSVSAYSYYATRRDATNLLHRAEQLQKVLIEQVFLLKLMEDDDDDDGDDDKLSRVNERIDMMMMRLQLLL
jgi:hypothetical protein